MANKAVKIYLSPACHGIDHPCAWGHNCSENTHANMFLDELIPYLSACGFEWKRNPANKKGSTGVQNAVKESNEWGADLHYVVHTNGSDGTVHSDRPMYWTKDKTGVGKALCEVIANWRKQIYPYSIIIKTKSNLYEMREAKAPCVYEELIFHDNRDDAVWLHQNMRLCAEFTCRAFCQYYGVRFIDPYRLKGDVDGDGKITSTDARLALQASVGKIELDEEAAYAADVDGDGTVTSTDARIILQKATGKS